MWIALSSLIVATIVPRAHHHQRTVERIFVDSILADIDAARTPSDLSSGLCTGHKPELDRYCTALILERRAELTGTSSDARAAEFGMERAVLELPRFAPAWYGLGRIRLALANDTLFSRGGAAMPVGTSYLTGAANAFGEAVHKDYTFTPALVALAQTPKGRESNAALKERIDIVRKVRAVLPAETLIPIAALERGRNISTSAPLTIVDAP